MVRPKKHLGQHFLKDETICENIADALIAHNDYNTVLEVGPGTGALTKYLLEKTTFETQAIEVDKESIVYLNEHYPNLTVHDLDFLRVDLDELIPDGNLAIAGNFPYNISSQILFKVVDYKDRIPEVVGMFQKEVAERVAEPPGSKKYGIISVLIQAFYDIEYLFTVHEHVFDPPPKVKSGVIRLTRNKKKTLNCDEKQFKKVVKMAFGQRRKTLRNSLRSLIPTDRLQDEIFNLRPERLSVEQFESLTTMLHQEDEAI